MKDTRVAGRYAAALFAAALRDGILDAVTQDLVVVERYIVEIPYLRAVLQQPFVSAAQKYKLAGDAFGDRITATSLNFVKLLIKKRRENLISECIRAYRDLLAVHFNTLEATASTAVPMTAEQAQRLTKSLEAITGKKVTLTTEVDSRIMGGVVVRMGDTIIDGSLRSRLLRLEERLLGRG